MCDFSASAVLLETNDPKYTVHGCLLTGSPLSATAAAVGAPGGYCSHCSNFKALKTQVAKLQVIAVL